MKVDVKLLIIILMLFSLLISYESFSQNWDVIYRGESAVDNGRSHDAREGVADGRSVTRVKLYLNRSV